MVPAKKTTKGTCLELLTIIINIYIPMTVMLNLDVYILYNVPSLIIITVLL